MQFVVLLFSLSLLYTVTNRFCKMVFTAQERSTLVDQPLLYDVIQLLEIGQFPYVSVCTQGIV